MPFQTYEVNFDGISGPTHYYGGHSYGNLASMEHENKPSNPKQAALQGLEKMKFLANLGIRQAVLPPHERPEISLFRKLGFSGSDKEIIQKASSTSPHLFFQCCTSSSMWAANAATACPSIDSKDRRVHLTAANLSTLFHRAIEAGTTYRILSAIFENKAHFAVHAPLDYGTQFSDEGAANHARFCKAHHLPGIHLFVFGRFALQKNTGAHPRFPARQSFEASEAISRLHLIPENRIIFAQQNPDAIEAGVFHNDVLSAGNERVFLYHEDAFVNTPQVIGLLQGKMINDCSEALCCIKAGRDELSLTEAVSSYLFNSQIVTLADHTMCMIAPVECMAIPKAKTFLEKILADSNNPITQLFYVDIRQSMQNGGGPACLRLRIVLTEKELEAASSSVFLTDALYVKLKKWIERHYRDVLTYKDLADPMFLMENQHALDELTQMLDLGSLYSFQRG
jgi:succinylarginine dihydrolase